jgi:hypothetical protein
MDPAFTSAMSIAVRDSGGYGGGGGYSSAENIAVGGGGCDEGDGGAAVTLSLAQVLAQARVSCYASSLCCEVAFIRRCITLCHHRIGRSSVGCIARRF